MNPNGTAVEMRRRSLVKALTWRVMGTFGTCLIGWCITGSLRLGLGISLVDSAVKLFGFYFHERAWHRVRWGLAVQEPADGQGGGI